MKECPFLHNPPGTLKNSLLFAAGAGRVAKRLKGIFIFSHPLPALPVPGHR